VGEGGITAAYQGNFVSASVVWCVCFVVGRGSEERGYGVWVCVWWLKGRLSPAQVCCVAAVVDLGGLQVT